MRRFVVLVAFVAAFGLVALGGYAVAQDSPATPEGATGPCATPVGIATPGEPAPVTADGASTPVVASCASPAATGGTSANAVTIEAVDINWKPKAVTIPADTDVTITIPNNGVALHTFVIEELGIKVEMAPGESRQVVINAPAGTYTFICDVPGHKEAGMVGSLTVQ